MDDFDQRKQELARQIAARWMERGFTVDYLVMEQGLDRKIIEQIFAGNVMNIELKWLQDIAKNLYTY